MPANAQAEAKGPHTETPPRAAGLRPAAPRTPVYTGADVDVMLFKFLNWLTTDPYVAAVVAQNPPSSAPTPRFVVIGEQNSGKSTVVDRVSGRGQRV
jgi:hypothetical protein